MRDLAFALLRVLAAAFIGMVALPGLLTMIVSSPLYFTEGFAKDAAYYWSASFTVAIIGVAIPVLIFLYARKIAVLIVPDKPLAAVSFDLPTITRAAFVVGGVSLLVKGASGVVILLGETFRWMSFMAKYHGLREMPNYHHYLQDAGELLVGAILLVVAWRLK
ncbi:hypothetical protein HK107_13465 [Parvularcula sp. ZS-1/3]|uniref:Uncharacterized protein n=1 Tax=Parvularcula mediterranea TaxID=2732508 RepID=A0A7Y3W652_9PROT|nr:hypothetical protein [Parvularcula mediterranea]NNU17334.1 hypothetical protein [Parvularcula mediterranea]